MGQVEQSSNLLGVGVEPSGAVESSSLGKLGKSVELAESYLTRYPMALRAHSMRVDSMRPPALLVGFGEGQAPRQPQEHVVVQGASQLELGDPDVAAACGRAAATHWRMRLMTSEMWSGLKP